MKLNVSRLCLRSGLLFENMDLTQIYRNILRIVLIFLIIGATIAFMNQKSALLSLPLTKRVDKAPQSVNLRLQYAGELGAKNEIGAARKQLLTVLNFDPINPYALSFYSTLEAKSTNLEEETAKIRGILALRPDYQRAWAKLATLYEYQGKVDLANDAKQKAAELAKKL